MGSSIRVSVGREWEQWYSIRTTKKSIWCICAVAIFDCVRGMAYFQDSFINGGCEGSKESRFLCHSSKGWRNCHFHVPRCRQGYLRCHSWTYTVSILEEGTVINISPTVQELSTVDDVPLKFIAISQKRSYLRFTCYKNGAIFEKSCINHEIREHMQIWTSLKPIWT